MTTYNTETPEEKEAFSVMAKDNEAVDLNVAPKGATHYGITGFDELLFFKCDNDVYLMWRDENWSLSIYANHEWLKKLPTLEQPKPKHTKEEVDWSNGDECKYMNQQAVHRFIGVDPRREGYCYIQAPCYSINFVEISKLSKPKAEREAFIEAGLTALNKMTGTKTHEVLEELFDSGKFKLKSK